MTLQEERPLPRRWSANLKVEVVLRLLQGEDLEVVAAECELPAKRLVRWCKVFLESGRAGLEIRLRTPVAMATDHQRRSLLARIAQLSAQAEALANARDVLEHEVGPLGPAGIEEVLARTAGAVPVSHVYRVLGDPGSRPHRLQSPALRGSPGPNKAISDDALTELIRQRLADRVVMRLLRGESADDLSAETGLPPSVLVQWRNTFVSAGRAGLKARTRDPATEAADHERRRLLARTEELVRDIAVLQAAVELLEGRLKRR